MDINVEKVVQTYRDIAKIPSVVSGTLVVGSASRYKLNTVWQQRDLERTENIKFSICSTLKVDGNVVEKLEDFTPSEIGKELLSKYSPCGSRRAIIREVTGRDFKKVQYLEIWDGFKKDVNFNLTEANKHGVVHFNEQFSSLEWSKDGRKILYIAEKRLPKTRSYFKPVEKDDESKPGNEHLWIESWGEQLTDAHHPMLCVFEVECKKLSFFSDLIPDELSVGQAIWHHDSESVIFVGWVHEPHRLGIIYCPIRNSRLYVLNAKKGICKLISDADKSVRTPRLHPKENRVFYLENQAGGPHMNCARLMSVNIPDLDTSAAIENKIIVDVVKSSKSKNDFPGIFAQGIVNQCFSSDGRFLFMDSAWRSHNSILKIDLTNGDVTRITEDGDWSILDVKDDVMVASYSTPSNPPQICVTKFQNGSSVNWTTVVKPSHSLDVKWKVCDFKPDLENPDYPDVECEYILYEPEPGISNKALIVNTHGGPHTHKVAGFVHSVIGMVKLGFTVVQVNYRGSTGFGQNGIDSLPGRAGVQDVKDNHEVAKMIKNSLKCDRVFVTGGSYGGFLSLHLISQFPDFYIATCAQNPVTNMSIMYGTSDIPDWSFCESGVDTFSMAKKPVDKYYTKMLEKSPVSLIQNARAPCLVMLGEVDLRVPPTQGLQWAKLYKALGQKCKVLEYKDNCHPLSKVDAEADWFVNLIMWFKENEDALDSK